LGLYLVASAVTVTELVNVRAVTAQGMLVLLESGVAHVIVHLNLLLMEVLKVMANVVRVAAEEGDRRHFVNVDY
jgi:hypothetical protein